MIFSTEGIRSCQRKDSHIDNILLFSSINPSVNRKAYLAALNMSTSNLLKRREGLRIDTETVQNDCTVSIVMKVGMCKHDRASIG